MKKRSLRHHIVLLARDQRGATAVEYGMILALIFLAVAGGVTALGNSVQSRWNTVANTVAKPV